MKQLKVPYLECLDDMGLSEIGPILETEAVREYIHSVNWKEYPYCPIAVFDIARSKTCLYLRYFIKGYSLKAVYNENGSNVHKDSCVEFFCKKPEDKQYINFEFNCIGTCDAAHRESREIKTPFTAEEYAQIRHYATAGTQPFEERKGIHSGELTVAIPFRLMGIDEEHLPQKLLANFYHCADETDYPRFISWNPIDVPSPDFHRPEYFGEIYL